MKITFDAKQFSKEMEAILKYSEGYLDGIQAGKQEFLNRLGKTVKELLEAFVDSQARIDHTRLHHVYEWYREGSPESRLFDISYSVVGGGLTFNSTFSQSRSIARGATEPFYDKARIMEDGLPVIIRPRQSDVLAFEIDGQMVYSKKPIEISHPGGEDVNGSFQNTVNLFFERYLTQSFLMQSGFTSYIESSTDFKANLSSAKSGGYSKGKQIGYNWIVKAGEKI